MLPHHGPSTFNCVGSTAFALDTITDHHLQPDIMPVSVMEYSYISCVSKTIFNMWNLMFILWWIWTHSASLPGEDKIWQKLITGQNRKISYSLMWLLLYFDREDSNYRYSQESGVDSLAMAQCADVSVASLLDSQHWTDEGYDLLEYDMTV